MGLGFWCVDILIHTILYLREWVRYTRYTHMQLTNVAKKYHSATIDSWTVLCFL